HGADPLLALNDPSWRGLRLLRLLVRVVRRAAALLRRSRGRARVSVPGWRALLVFALLAALPLAPGMSRYYLLLAFDGLLFGAIAMSLDLLMGYTVLVSFGHAAFYGLGAYATAILMERGVQSVWACIGAALLLVGLYALVVSYFATARRGIYFALLTLIFAEVVYTFFRYTQTFGGSDGIQGLPDATLFPGLVIDTPTRKYYLVLAYLAVAYAICRVLV